MILQPYQGVRDHASQGETANMKSKWILMSALAAALSMAVPGFTQTPAAKTTEQAKSSTKTKTAATTPAPTAPEIADAKAKGLVWVNTSTKVY